jgi:hypothetical protein
MAGVNAYRSRNDAEKIKLGLERKHQDGGSSGPARIGYLNAREVVGHSEIAIDPERATLVQTAFEQFATGNYTITGLTDLLDELGLRRRATPKLPSRPLSRSAVHRLLKDDFYIGSSQRRESRFVAATRRSSMKTPSSACRRSSRATRQVATALTSISTISRGRCGAIGAGGGWGTGVTVATAASTNTSAALAASLGADGAGHPISR